MDWASIQVLSAQIPVESACQDWPILVHGSSRFGRYSFKANSVSSPLFEQHENAYARDHCQDGDRNTVSGIVPKTEIHMPAGDSRTMMLATEPRIVRLPANVVAKAMTFHINCG